MLFGGYLLYDTQKIIHHSERDATYDPVNMYVISLSLSLDQFCCVNWDSLFSLTLNTC